MLYMITCIVQARIGSSRLPGKTMKIITEHKRIIDFVVGQLQSSKLIEKIIIAIPDLIEDDLTYHHLVSKNISVFRGSAKNVLDRYYQCAKITSSSIIVRVTADCPLIDPEIIDNVIQKFIENKFDYVANTHPRTFPYGTETEVFSFNALEISLGRKLMMNLIKNMLHHIFIKILDKFKIGNFSNKKINQSKLSLDNRL